MALPILAMLVSSAGAYARDLALPMTAIEPECRVIEPDSVEISWQTPCETGNWLLDTETGCRMWDWHPDLRDHATWTGGCPRGTKDGHGVVQWFEHGQAIDRFEGTFHAGKREGFGRYQWNATDRYEGHYANDVPDGFGAATVAGETFAGEWTKGCFGTGDRTVAIGVPRTSCTGGPAVALNRRQAAAF